MATALNETAARRFWILSSLVAHAGFEPAISTLRGWCPRPLDECATLRQSHLCGAVAPVR